MVSYNRGDLDFILTQIKISEAHSGGAELTDLVPHPLLPWGVRTVDGTLNNLVPGRETWGSADQPFPRLTDPTAPAEGTLPDVPFAPGPGAPPLVNTDYGLTTSVVDTAPRTISNLIVDQTITNFAAVVSALERVGSADAYGDAQRLIDAKVTQAEADAAVTAADAAVDTANADFEAAIAAFVSGDLTTYDAIQIAANNLSAAEAAYDAAVLVAADPEAAFLAVATELGLEITANGTIVNLNLAPDEGISASFNSWMTLFGQFFDHGLDLVAKTSASKVYIPLQPDDPLYVEPTLENPFPQNFMVVTRTTADAPNLTTPFVDQNQTYTSHASHQVFLREYSGDSGAAVATGHLLEGFSNNLNGGLATWADVKAQAVGKLGLVLDDMHIHEVPLLATDLYGMFERSPSGHAMVMVEVALVGGGTITAKASGNAGGLDLRNIEATDLVASSLPLGFDLDDVASVTALGTGHAFLDDIAHTAAPALVDPDRNPGTDNSVLTTPDADLVPGNGFTDQVVNEFGVRLTYDNELLDRHFITGDGRGNENIGLTAVHHVFHSEHNRLAEHTKEVVLGQNDLAFLKEWVLNPDDLTALPTTPAEIAALQWNGERLFQAARFGTEMQYQHMVFEEFARKVNPLVDLFVFNPTMDVNPAIFAEFAHVVYRFGHSMLTEDVARLRADGQTSDDIGLIDAFLDPISFNSRIVAGEVVEISADEAAGAIVRGMSRQTGNEIDEFVTEALRNNLLGLPLDLAAINLARGRETNMPTLQEARAQFYEMSRSEWLKPYISWADFTQHLKNPASAINFIAAYGTHEAILAAETLDDKRKAAMALVFGDSDGTPDSVLINGVERDISDRSDFLNATGNWAADTVLGASLGGLNNVDLWIGGLAEAILPFGGMLGSTFTFVFELQMENLQNGDRFYYLSRTQGLHFLTELENNAFSKIVMANTDLGAPGSTHLPGELFSTPQHILEINPLIQNEVDPIHDDPVLEAAEPKVARDLHLTVDGNTYDSSLKFTGGEHVVLGGDNNHNVLIGDLGDDTIWGDGGNDYIEGGHGVNRLHGGDGDDIIYGGGDAEFLHGDDGNDVIHAGNGIGDLVFGGAGHDFILAGEDGTEVFASEGNDFILGTRDMDFLLGGEGDDWIEGSEGFDTLAGDNSELFFNSAVIGHDVMFAGTNENDFDAESGDDIMVQGESVMRNEGMLGFDWVTFQEHQQFGVTVNMNVKIFTTVFDDILRNRFDRVEALSTTDFADVIIGDDRISPDGPFNQVLPVNEQSLEGDELLAQGVNRIAGLNELLGLTQEQVDAMGLNDVAFVDGNILLAGGGGDRITGGGGDDIIDGDKKLEVRIGIVDENGVEIGTAYKMQGPVTFNENASAELQLRSGAPLDEFMFDRSINPGNLRIVREIVDGGQVGDVDIAVFRGNFADYTVTENINGSWTVAHNVVVVGGGGGNVIADGTDTLWNVEVLQFADAVQIIDPSITNSAATGTLDLLVNGDLAADSNTAVGRTFSVATGSVFDNDGPVPPLSSFSIAWQVETTPGVWEAIVDPITEAPITGLTFTPTPAFALEGLRIRAAASFTDAHGIPEFVLSGESVALAAATVSPPATPLDDFIFGTVGNDEIIALAGDDEIMAFAGDDTLIGGPGNDILDGGVGNDTAVFDGPVTDFVFEITPEGILEVVNVATGVEDAVISIENFVFRDPGTGVVLQTLTLDEALALVGPAIAVTPLVASLPENAPAGTAVATIELVDPLLTAADVTVSDPVNFQVVEGGAGIELQFIGVGDFETNPLLAVTVSITTLGGVVTAALSLPVTDVNEDPIGVALIGAVDIAENNAATVIVGDIVIDDPEAAPGNNAVFVFDAGGGVSAEFEAVQNGAAWQLQFTGAADFEQRASYDLEIVALDLDLFGAPVSQFVTINVGDVNPDVFNGTGGNDISFGGASNDTLFGGFGGDDQLFGGEGDDAFRAWNGNDTFDGGGGSDSLAFTGWTSAITIDLGLAGPQAVVGGSVTVASIENVSGGSNHDRITGNDSDNVLAGGIGGNDIISGGLGNDTFRAWSGNDTFNGGGGSDTVTFAGWNGAVTIDLSLAGFQSVPGGAVRLNSIENIVGGNNRDRLTGNGEANVIEGGGQRDVMTGGAGDDTFVFRSVSDSAAGAGIRDLIVDFAAGDRIDVSAMLAGDFALLAGDNAAFTGAGGELRWFTDLANNRTIVEGTLDADTTPDFQVQLTGIHTLNQSSFLL